MPSSRAVAVDQGAVERVARCEGLERLHPAHHPHLDAQRQEFARVIAEPAGRERVIRRDGEARQSCGIEAPAAFHRLGYGLQRHPRAGEAGSSPAPQRPAPHSRRRRPGGRSGLTSRPATYRSRSGWMTRWRRGRPPPPLRRRLWPRRQPRAHCRMASPARSRPGPLPYQRPNTPSTLAPRVAADALCAGHRSRCQVLVYRRAGTRYRAHPSDALARHSSVSTPASGEPR